MLEQLKPWTRLYEVIGVLGPVFLFSFVFSLLVYVLFVGVLPLLDWRARFGNLSSRRIEPETNQAGSDQSGSGDVDAQFGYAGSFTYVLVASLFGVVLGMLVKLVGGFTALASSTPANTLVGAIGSALVIVVGVVAVLFADSGKIALRRPVGAIAFLVSFLVSGFYWQFLRGAVG
jgi:hypothetical protein